MKTYLIHINAGGAQIHDRITAASPALAALVSLQANRLMRYAQYAPAKNWVSIVSVVEA